MLFILVPPPLHSEEVGQFEAFTVHEEVVKHHLHVDNRVHLASVVTEQYCCSTQVPCFAVQDCDVTHH